MESHDLDMSQTHRHGDPFCWGVLVALDLLGALARSLLDRVKVVQFFPQQRLLLSFVCMTADVFPLAIVYIYIAYDISKKISLEMEAWFEAQAKKE